MANNKSSLASIYIITSLFFFGENMSPSVSVCGFFGEKFAAPDDQRSNQICYRPRPRPLHCLSVTEGPCRRHLKQKKHGWGVCYPKKFRRKITTLGRMYPKKDDKGRVGRLLLFFFLVFCRMWRKVLGQGLFWLVLPISEKAGSENQKKNGASFCSDI